MSTTLVVESATPTSFQRLPSTRPIDHRWDRSRGIIFRAAKRTVSNNQTWSHPNGIVFAPSPASSAGYATRSFQDTNNSPKLGTKVSTGVPSSHGMGIPGGLNVAVRMEIEELNSKVKALSEKNRVLEQDKRLREYNQKRNTVNEAELKESLQTITNLRQRASQAEAEARVARQEGLLEGHNRQQTTIDKLKSESQELSQILSKVGIIARHARAAHIREFPEDLLSSPDQIIADLEKVPGLTDVIEDARQSGMKEGAKLLQPKIDRLVVEQNQSSSREQALQTQLKISSSREEALQNQVRIGKAKQANLVETVNRQREVMDGRIARRKVDRSQYEDYRALFDDFGGGLYTVLEKLRPVVSSLEAEARMWDRCARVFGESPQLQLFRPAYPELASAIKRFSDAKATSRREILAEFEHVKSGLMTRFEEFKTAGHRSRSLTNFLYYKDPQNEFESVDLALAMAIVGPIRSYRDNLDRKLDFINRQIRLSPRKEISRTLLRQRLLTINGIAIISKCLQIVETLRRIRGMELILNAPNIEKAKWLRLMEVYGLMGTQHSKALQGRLSEKPLRSDEYKDILHAKYLGRNTLRDVRVMFENYMAILHKKITLEADLSVLNEKDLNAEVFRLLERAKSQADNQLMMLLQSNISGVRTRLSEFIPSRPLDGQSLAPRQASNLDQSQAGRRRRQYRRSAEQHDRKAAEPADANEKESYTPAVEGHGRAKYSPWTGRASIKKPPSVRQAGRRSIHTTQLNVSGLGQKFESSLDLCHDPVSILASTHIESQQRPLSAHVSRTEEHTPKFSALGKPFDGESHGQNSFWQKTSTDESKLCFNPEQRSFSDDLEDVKELTIDVAQPKPTMDQQESPMTYTISSDVLGQSSTVSAASNGPYWSYKMYRNPGNQTPKVYYCTTFDQSEERAQLFMDEPILGFDIEWDTNPMLKSRKNAVSLIQIACEGKIGLFQIGMFDGVTAEELMPPTLKRILEDSAVVKAGVNIGGDATRLRTHLGTQMKGMIELSHLYKLVKYEPGEVNFKLVSMATQVREILGFELKKDSVRTSCWSFRLNGSQTEYAATDAYAGYQLYCQLEIYRKLMSPAPPRPPFSELNHPLVLGDGTLIYKSGSLRTMQKTLTKDAAIGNDANEASEEFYEAEEYLFDEAGFVPDAALEPGCPPGPSSEMDRQHQSGIKPALKSEVSSHSQRSSTKSHRQTQTRERPDSAEITDADAWAAKWRSDHPSSRTGPSTLRAYHIWHEQGLALPQIAALCAQPPLKIATVASYILTAIKEEALPFESSRVVEVLKVIPPHVHYRYRKIVESIESNSG